MQKITGIILAGGKGSRLKCKSINKTAIPFNGKPLIQYSVDLFDQVVDEAVIVVGAFADSIKTVVGSSKKVRFAHQRKRLGTGHAARVAMAEIEKSEVKPQIVLIGYGDHMMFYSAGTMKNLLDQHVIHQSAVSLLSTNYFNPDSLAWGRIIRNNQDEVERIIEQKDATGEQRQITELNAGFYCIDYPFLKKALKKLKKSLYSGEYYLTDIIEIAKQEQQKVIAVSVPFHEVGFGANTYEQLAQSQTLLNKN